MVRTNRWMGLALVAVLALSAQPAAVGTGNLASASADEDPANQQCSAPADAALLDEAPDLQEAEELPEVEESLCEAASTVDGALETTSPSAKVDRAVGLR